MRIARQRDRHDDAVGLIDRFLDKGDDVAVFDGNEAQLAGLLQRRVFAADAVEFADIGLDVVRPVPVAHLDLVFFGIQIFLPARNCVVLQQLEAIIDAVAARQRGGERDTGLEHPALAALQMKGEDVGRVDEKVRTIEISLRIGGEFDEILLQLPFLGPPGEVGIGLGKAELGKPLHQFWPGERFGEEDHVGMAKLDPADQPFPECKWLGVGIVDPEDLHALFDPEQHDVAQGVPQRAGILG